MVPLRKLKKLLSNDDGEAADFILDAQPALAKVLTGSEITTLQPSWAIMISMVR